MATSDQPGTRDHDFCRTKWYDQLEEILTHKESDDEDLLNLKEDDELKEIADEYFCKESELGEGKNLLRDYLLKEMKKETRLVFSAKKDEDFTNCCSPVCRFSELVTVSDTKELYILEPSSTKIWKILRTYMNEALKELDGVEKKIFSCLLKCYSLEMERDHIEGFKPEVAWVTRAGEHDLLTPFSLRPTSETIIYPYNKTKIRTHCDLRMKVNQWVKVVRWEVSDPIPLIRGREFDWQEGHTTFATKEEAYDGVLEFLSIYSCVYEKLLAVPVIKGVKSGTEKFLGADYTTSVEVFIPTNGRGVQVATSHCLEKNIKSMVWQNSWGLSTRSIGAMAMTRGDEKGLVILPNMARYQAVVIHVPFKGADTKKIFGECKAGKTILQGAGVCAIGDERDNYACGWKYADWEMKGVLFIIEIGPSELEKNDVRIVRWGTGIKMDVVTMDVVKKVKDLMEESIQKVETWDEFKEALRQKKLSLSPWCDEVEMKNVVLKKSYASLVGICSVIDQRATSLSQIMDSVLLNGSEENGKFDIEEDSKSPKTHGKFRDVLRSVHLDDEEHGKKKRKRNTWIKFKGTRYLIGVQDLAKKDFKFKGENVESKLEGKACGASYPKDIWKVKEIGNMLV
ncbi:proline--tRNA ligase, cytoplasmic-like [Brassica napus]|uniref:proline--tRNA ligase, cytoplasmic-like n=1 Tax=Brassica napus TaxID=3708 RepID=UPI002079558E|nr:proline--tRNA ligase, cytoplasmic-like [Brassica napus]